MKLNRTTLRTVEILKLVSKKTDGITLDEICAKLDMPKTSAYDIDHTGADRYDSCGKGTEAEIYHRPDSLPDWN